MKAGDLVRFRSIQAGKFGGLWDDIEWRIGLLIEYQKWEKVGTVLWRGKTYRVRAENIQKAGKKDYEDR